jgi:hypothetical protein
MYGSRVKLSEKIVDTKYEKRKRGMLILKQLDWKRKNRSLKKRGQDNYDSIRLGL